MSMDMYSKIYNIGECTRYCIYSFIVNRNIIVGESERTNFVSITTN